jgi:hypothetical protein
MFNIMHCIDFLYIDKKLKLLSTFSGLNIFFINVIIIKVINIMINLSIKCLRYCQ